MFRNIIISMSILLLLFTLSYAQEPPLTITDTKAEPSTVSTGGKVLISCMVTHSGGAVNIERVAATVVHGKWNTQYSMLYDDGTNGDSVEGDGIYSLEITASNEVGEGKIVFQAVDKDRNEIESEPVFLTVK